MKDCHCNEPKPGFIPAPHKPSGCVPKPCDYIKTYFLPTSLGTDEAGQPYAPKPGAWYDAFVIYEANAAIYFYDHEGIFLHIGGGGVTSINGETGDITLGTLTISMNGGQLAQYNAGQSVELTCQSQLWARLQQAILVISMEIWLMNCKPNSL